MASSYEVEVTINSAKDLKNINWRHGSLKPYAVVWLNSDSKCSTLVDPEGDTCPQWNHTLVIPFYSPFDDTILHVDIVHADAAEDTKPLIGSAKLPLNKIAEELGGESTQRRLELKRPSGRPQGKLELTVQVRELRSFPPSYAAAAPPAYCGPYAAAAVALPAYGGPYVAPAVPAPQQAYGGSYVAPPPYNNYGSYNVQAPNPYPYTSGAQSGSYNNNEGQKSKSGMGTGTGVAVGVVAGLLGGLALAEGIDYVEDKIADDIAEKVIMKDDLDYYDDDY